MSKSKDRIVDFTSGGGLSPRKKEETPEASKVTQTRDEQFLEESVNHISVTCVDSACYLKIVRNLCSRPYEHPYRTRSKTLREVKSTADLMESYVLSRHSSNCSVVYLGSFHKSPQLITLEDSNEGFPEGVVQPKTREPV